MIHPHVVNGETLWLVQPQHIGCKWTQDTKHLRSSVWNDGGELVSAGFPKFVNWGENPEHFPVPTSLKNTTIVEKVDGSLLIVSKYKGNVILRTRGTVDATKLDNGHELELFKELVLSKIPVGQETWDYSYLFEWVSPLQRIILNYGDQPNWYLVGSVNHWDYSLTDQSYLNDLAVQFGTNRPAVYSFPSVEDLMKDVEAWKGKEGVVVYSDGGQTLHKVKAASYLFLHRMKQELGSIDKVIDVWFSRDKPLYSDFEAFIVNTFDYELWKMIRPEVSKICDAWKEVQQIIEGMKKFVNDTLISLPSRKEQAGRVLSAYSVTNRASMIFSLLDGKTLTADQEKKLLYQCLKHKVK